MEKYETSDLLTKKYLLLRHLPTKGMIFVVPLALILMLLLPEQRWHFLLAFSCAMVFVQITQFYICKRRHENLLAPYGEAYVQKLNHELEFVGMEILLKRYWVGLEPEGKVEK